MGVDRSLVGRRWGPFRYTVGLEKLREYATAISGGTPILGLSGVPEDVHPVLYDEAAAALGPYGSVIGFPTFAVTFAMAPFGAALLDPALGVDLLRLVHGEQDFEFLEVLRPGDVLTTHGELVEVSQRGRNELLVVRTESKNQHGRTAVRGRFTGLIRGQ
jgi:acyl dehydratase